jgi:hypothetical protein
MRACHWKAHGGDRFHRHSSPAGSHGHHELLHLSQAGCHAVVQVSSTHLPEVVWGAGQEACPLPHHPSFSQNDLLQLLILNGHEDPAADAALPAEASTRVGGLSK